MIVYEDNLDQVTKEMLNGFFTGWKIHPSPEKFLEILKNSEYKILAIDDDKNKVIGFINAISDKVLSVFIPLLEVLPEYQRQGIGSELAKRMLDKLKDYYMIDLVCDEDLEKFYLRFGMTKHSSMIKRNYQNQYGIKK